MCGYGIILCLLSIVNACKDKCEFGRDVTNNADVVNLDAHRQVNESRDDTNYGAALAPPAARQPSKPNIRRSVTPQSLKVCGAPQFK